MYRTAKIFKKVHSAVHFLDDSTFNDDMKPLKKYSIGFYPAKEIARWSTLSKKEREAVLKKEWYLRWSYRNPETGKMQRQDNIKAGINFYKTKRERIEILKTLQRNLERLLKSGYSPYNEDTADIDDIKSLEEAFAFGMELKNRRFPRTHLFALIQDQTF